MFSVPLLTLMVTFAPTGIEMLILLSFGLDETIWFIATASVFCCIINISWLAKLGLSSSTALVFSMAIAGGGGEYV